MAVIFISGVAGFLGSHLANAMINDGHIVVGVDNLIGGDRENVSPEVYFYKADCNDYATMKELTRNCDVVFHCAALAYEGLSVFSPHVVTQSIFGAAVSLFSAAISNGVKRIVTCSSMARYGSIPAPFYEKDEPRPQDPYGIAKLATESVLRNLCEVHGVEYAIAVPHNIIGPRQKYDDPFRNVASIMLNLMLQDRAPIIYGDGEQRRCFSYIEDVLQCLKKMAFVPEAVGQVINIGPDEGSVAIRELYDVCARETSFDREPRFMPGRPQEVFHATCCSRKARALLDYKTEWTLPQGIQRMADFIRDHGTKPFQYHLPIEIVTDTTPKTWVKQMF
jgi:UDP-glucose 4-epimerase